MSVPVFGSPGGNLRADYKTQDFSVSGFSRSGKVVAAKNNELTVDAHGFHVHHGFAFVDAHGQSSLLQVVRHAVVCRGLFSVK